MVNRHFSLACHACREKHTRCDETRPACRKCTSKGRECPGYRDTNGFLFIDQVERSAKRVRRKRKCEASQSPDSDATTAAVKIMPTVQPDPGLVSVTFFFRNCLTSGRNPLTSRGHFDHLLPLYNKARPSSLLALAMELAAGRSMASYYCRSVDSIWHAESLVRASAAMRSAISDAVECLKDETLLAVLLLDFAEYIKTRTMRTALSHVHQNAAMGLVRLRGEQNLESEVASSLVHATRSNSLYRAMHGHDCGNVDEALLTYMTADFEECNPALRLDGLIARGMCLGQKLAKALKTGCKEMVLFVGAELERFNNDLLAWRGSLPEDWSAQSHINAETPTGFGVMGPCRKDQYVFETFGTLDVALIVNQWRCTRLMTIKLLRLCRGPCYPQNDLDAKAADLIKDVWKSVPFFIHGPRLSILTGDSKNTLPEVMQQLQREGPSGLGMWFLGQILDWIIPVLEELGDIMDVDRANVVAFRDLREALHSKMQVVVPSCSRSV